MNSMDKDAGVIPNQQAMEQVVLQTPTCQKVANEQDDQQVDQISPQQIDEEI
jgi:hypothetical protein